MLYSHQIRRINYRVFLCAGDGKCGITLNIGYSKANQSSVRSDVEAADRAMQFDLGWFAHPIFSDTGDYPEVMRNRVKERSEQQNLTTSRLPAFSQENIDELKGELADFYLAHQELNKISIISS